MDGNHMRFSLMLRVAWELYLRHGKNVHFRDTSSVVYLWIRGCFGLTPSSKVASYRVIKPELVSHTQSWHLRSCLKGAAHGTMQGRGVLLPESSLELIAYVVHPPPGGFWPGFSSGGWGGGGLGQVDVLFWARLIHIHWLLLSASSETDLIVCHRACPWIPRSNSSLMVEEATKPLHPTSTG